MTKQKIQELIDQLTASLVDADKFEAGNDAAGKRIRAVAQSVKNDLQALRLEIQAERNSRKA